MWACFSPHTVSPSGSREQAILPGSSGIIQSFGRSRLLHLPPPEQDMWPRFERLWLFLAGMIAETSGFTDQENITAIPGETVTLQCQAPTNISIAAVEWTRPDLEPEYVLFCRSDQKPDVENQHPSFQNRVDLMDRQMKDGDVSMILKNVTSDDTGTYECHIINEKNKSGSKRKKRANFDTDAIKSIYLDVHQSGHTAGHDEGGGNKDGGEKNGRYGLVAVVVLFFLLLLLVMLFPTCRRHREQNLHQPPADVVGDDLL